MLRGVQQSMPASGAELIESASRERGGKERSAYATEDQEYAWREAISGGEEENHKP